MASDQASDADDGAALVRELRALLLNVGHTFLDAADALAPLIERFDHDPRARAAMAAGAASLRVALAGTSQIATHTSNLTGPLLRLSTLIEGN